MIMKENDNMTAIEVYDLVKPQGRLEVPVRINVSGYAVKVGPDVFGLPSVEVSENKDGRARVLPVYYVYSPLRTISNFVTSTKVIRS